MNTESIRAMVLAYIAINPRQHEATIAHALDLTVDDVRRALAG